MVEYVIYCDTDSVMNIQKVDEAPKVKKGDYLSDLTDTLEEFSYWSFIEDVVSGDPKTMHFWSFSSYR